MAPTVWLAALASPQASLSSVAALTLRAGLRPWDSIQHITGPADHSPGSTWTGHPALATPQHVV